MGIGIKNQPHIARRSFISSCPGQERYISPADNLGLARQVNFAVARKGQPGIRRCRTDKAALVDRIGFDIIVQIIHSGQRHIFIIR